ncbi:MAG: hypothetical protein ACR2P3_06770, partial [Geminicoccaceae bacterium]
MTDQDWIAAAIKETFTYFSYTHLPGHLQDVSKDYHQLAERTIDRAPGRLQTLHSLERLLEAKDCAVRAVLRFPRAA